MTNGHHQPCQWGFPNPRCAQAIFARPGSTQHGGGGKRPQNHHVLYRFAGGVPISKGYLEDHPMTCKWSITMVIVGPLSPK